MDLNSAYQIAILAKEHFFPDEEFFHTFEYYDPVNHISLNGRSRILTLELSKLTSIVEKPIEEMTISERWAVYFGYLTDKEKRSKINGIVSIEEGIAMASEVLLTISRDEEERARIMRDEKIELDYQSEIVYWERLAMEKGIEKGRIDTDRNALAKGYPIETILDITGLDMETLKSIQTSP